jgi:hypothetical protein
MPSIVEGLFYAPLKYLITQVLAKIPEQAYA